MAPVVYQLLQSSERAILHNNEFKPTFLIQEAINAFHYVGVIACSHCFIFLLQAPGCFFPQLRVLNYLNNVKINDLDG